MNAPPKAFAWQDSIGPERECAPTFKLDDHIAEARKAMGEQRWAELNAEWTEAAALGARGSSVGDKRNG